MSARGVIAILVVDSKRSYRNERLYREIDETAEEFGERVKQAMIKLQANTRP